MRWEQKIQYATKSDIGFRRQNNEDSLAVQLCQDAEEWENHGHLFVVADGMGGHAVGELASKIAVDTVPHTFFKSKEETLQVSLKKAIELANANIYERGSQNRDFARMGTTCSTLALTEQGAFIGHVGDSRVYRVRQNRIDQLTCDHSLQWELMRRGKLSPDKAALQEPRHIITRSLGPEEKVEVDLEGPHPVFPGDIYVLCSDGLNGHLQDDEIGMIVQSLSPVESSRSLVNLANLRGGSDNVSVIVVKVGDLPDGVPAPTPAVKTEREVAEELKVWWMIGFWISAILLTSGIVLILVGRVFEGAFLTLASLTSCAALFSRWHKKRKAWKEQFGDLSETIYGRTYRSTSCKLNRKFLLSMSSVAADLERSATEDHWEIDWHRIKRFLESARTQMDRDEWRKSLQSYSSAIEEFMVGVHKLRRQTKQKAKRRQANSN